MAKANGKMPWGMILSIVIIVLGAGSFFAATNSNNPQPSVGTSLAYTALAGVIMRICVQKNSVAVAAMISFLVLFFVIAPVLQH